MQGSTQAGLPLKLRSPRRAGIGADRRDVRCTDGARAHSPPLTVTPPAGIIAPSLFEVGVGRFLRREPVMTLVMLIVAAVLGWGVAGLAGAAAGVGVGPLAHSVAEPLWALL